VYASDPSFLKIGSSAKPSIPSDISADAQEFLQRTFELNHDARPSAEELLEHPWISKKPTVFPKGSAPKANPAIEVTS
jgi:mitogen-activated protein kinase kinase kinase